MKAEGSKNRVPVALLVMVDGAAGAGKSETIKILKETVELILQRKKNNDVGGESTVCPHILLCAPTGTAAVNIKGQTLHSAFGFTFGDDHYSLSDNVRDTKRATFKNLRFLIIDEVSMVKVGFIAITLVSRTILTNYFQADQLYQLDLRLREVMMKPDKNFGGVAIFLFGDIMQLFPVRGKPIWTQPRSAEYHQAFAFSSHWESFQTVSLVENHRQEADAAFADLLNRVRIGEQTPDDLECLMKRVRKTGHPDLKGAMVIASTHKVNFYSHTHAEHLFYVERW